VSPDISTVYIAEFIGSLCKQETDTLFINVTPRPELVIDNIVVYARPGLETVLMVTVVNPILEYTYCWTYNDIDVQSGSENTYTVPNGQFGKYLITVIDGNDCFSDLIIEVRPAKKNTKESPFF